VVTLKPGKKTLQIILFQIHNRKLKDTGNIYMTVQ
jgi:hypothetical protein